MTGLQRFNSPPIVQRIGNDSIYGIGSDGTVIIASNTSLTRDMYYENLTINSGSHLNTNGFRVFVKNVLTVNGTIGVNNDSSISTGTVTGTTSKATSTSFSIGGSAAGSVYTASQVSPQVLQDISNAVLGVYYETTGTARAISGGAGGQDGAAGVVTSATAGTGRTLGTAGGAGGAGGAGTLNRNALAPGGPGTAGSSGTSGTPGTNGTAGSTPPAAAAGVGARGGGVVIIAAKSIIGSGSILSRGANGAAGGSAATGTGATNGADGVNGSVGAAGTTAPTAHLSHNVFNHAPYRTGDGSHGPHAHVGAPTLPSYTVTGTISDHAHGWWVTTHHGSTPLYPANHHGGSSPWSGSASTTHAPRAAASGYYHQNNINHTNGGHIPTHGNAVATNLVHTSGAQGHREYVEHDAHHYETDHKHGAHGCCSHASRHRQDQYGQHLNRDVRSVGNSYQHGHAPYAGGSGGSGGTAGSKGLAGSAGTNGSTTAGTFGLSGGGGGIIFITDALVAGTLTVSTSGGAANSATASSGMVITVLNQ
jgi:hypothetical protein